MLEVTRQRKVAEPLADVRIPTPSAEDQERLREKIRQYRKKAEASAKVRDLNGGIEDNPYMPRDLDGGPRLPFRPFR